MMNTINTELFYVKVWFTDQVSKALEIEDNVNLTLIDCMFFSCHVRVSV